MGFINGHLVMKLRITPVIATLITLSLFKGIALLIVPDGLPSIKSTATQEMPAWINNYGREDVLLGLPWAFWIAILMIVVWIVIQRKMVIGKYAAAIGGNRLAAELSGINAVRVGWIIYILVGVFAALGRNSTRQAICLLEILSRVMAWKHHVLLPYCWVEPRSREARDQH